MAAVSGLIDGLSRNIRLMQARSPERVAAALFAEVEIEMTEMKARTPVDTGALRASGYVKPPTFSGRQITVEIGFGGPAAPYAVVVHEDTEAFHTVGQAKFVESVLNESGPYMPTRVGRRLDLAGIIGG